MFLRTFFSENDDFIRETKKCAVRKKYRKKAPRKVTILQIQGNHVGKRR
jgi:hypothetical protein